MRLSLATAALLLMDFQHDVLGGLPDGEAVVARAAGVLTLARRAELPILHVRVAFRPGHPEVSHSKRAFAAVARASRLVDGTEGAAIHAAVAPREGEPVATKRRVNPFTTTELGQVLAASSIDTLVVLGVHTGGVVLSTVRTAADLDYGLVVVADGCADPDPEVHRVLVEKVFPRQATVVASTELEAMLDGR